MLLQLLLRTRWEVLQNSAEQRVWLLYHGIPMLCAASPLIIHFSHLPLYWLEMFCGNRGAAMVVQSPSYPHQKNGAISVLFTPKAGVNKHFLVNICLLYFFCLANTRVHLIHSKSPPGLKLLCQNSIRPQSAPRQLWQSLLFSRNKLVDLPHVSYKERTKRCFPLNMTLIILLTFQDFSFL